MSDPSDLTGYDEVQHFLKREIELAVVSESLLLQVLDRVYRRTDAISGLARELEQDIGDSIVDFRTLGAGASAEEAPVVRLLQTLFEDATQINASDIHIEPQERRLQIRFRIDGVLILQTEADTKSVRRWRFVSSSWRASTFQRSVFRKMVASMCGCAINMSMYGCRRCQPSTASRSCFAC